MFPLVAKKPRFFCDPIIDVELHYFRFPVFAFEKPLSVARSFVDPTFPVFRLSNQIWRQHFCSFRPIEFWFGGR